MEVDLFYGIRSKRSVYGNGSRLNPTVSGYITTLNTENGSRLNPTVSDYVVNLNTEMEVS